MIAFIILARSVIDWINGAGQLISVSVCLWEGSVSIVAFLYVRFYFGYRRIFFDLRPHITAKQLDSYLEYLEFKYWSSVYCIGAIFSLGRYTSFDAILMQSSGTIIQLYERMYKCSISKLLNSLKYGYEI